MVDAKAETYSDYKDILDTDVIARILGVRKCPVDSLGTPLLNIRKQRVSKVLPETHFGVIFTPRLEVCDKNGIVLRLGKDYRGVDDMTYKTYPEIQRVMPRCYSILLIFRRDNETLVRREIMHGYYKFGGSARDEDSNISTSGLFEQAPLSFAERVVITEKANGKAAVISMFRFEGKIYFFGGSKGDHYITPADNPRAHLQRLNRNLFAFYIFDVFTEIWETLGEAAKEELSNKLCGSGSDCGYTLCAEYEDGRHMVPLPLDDRGNMVNDNLCMFGLVRNHGAIKKGVTLCEDVTETLRWFRRLGLYHTPFHVKEIKEFNAIKEFLREGSLKEGYVLHYQRRNGKRFETIAVEKYKIWWYIVLRILREFMRREQNIRRRNWPSKLWLRLKDRNVSYMKMSEELLQKWYRLLCKFVEWFFAKKYDRYVPLISFESGSLGMGTMWREFLFDYPSIDDTFGFFKDPVAHASWMYKKGRLKPRHNITGCCLVIFQGIPGLGKSTLTSYLVQKLLADEIPCTSLEQDLFAERFGSKKSGSLCLRELGRRIKSERYKVIFLSRNNACASQYSRYASLAKSLGWEVHVFAPKSILNYVHLTFVCLQSVYQRSFKKDHPTFKNLSLKRQLELTLTFLVNFKRAEEGEFVDSVHDVHWLSTEAVTNKMALVPTKICSNYLRELIAFFAKSQSGHFSEMSDAESVIKRLALDEKNYQIWRNSPECVSVEVAERLYQIIRSAGRCPKPPKRQLVRADMHLISLVIDRNSQEILQSVIDHYNFDMTDIVIPKLDHLTMIYENKDDNVGSKIWRELVPMAHEARELGILIKGVAYWPKNLLCFTAEVKSKVSLSQGCSLLRLVFSKHPHITAAAAKGVLPVESIKLLKYLSKEEAGEDRVFIPLKETILLSGVVTIGYKANFQRKH